MPTIRRNGKFSKIVRAVALAVLMAGAVDELKAVNIGPIDTDINGNITVAVDVVDTTNSVTGNGRLFKNGLGTLVINGPNSAWTGWTELQEGILRIDHDLALNTWSSNPANFLQSQGQVVVTGSGTVIQIDADRTLTNRFTVNDVSKTFQFDIAPTATLTINGVINSATNTPSGAHASYHYGGAILIGSSEIVNGNITPLFVEGGSLVLSNNETLGEGGGGLAAYNYDPTNSSNSKSSAVNLATLNSATFRNNAAAKSGGGFLVQGGADDSVNGNATALFGNDVLFDGNKSRNSGNVGGGGGIYAFSGNGAKALVQMGNNITFTGNSAGSDGNGHGGAIFINSQSSRDVDHAGKIQIGSNAYFSGNTAHLTSTSGTGGGGAIATTHDVSLSGNTFFTQNSTSRWGGALSRSIIDGATGKGTFSLDASQGDIAFTDNYHQVTTWNAGVPDTSTGVKNSIYLAHHTTLEVKGSHNVFFDDPIWTDKVGNTFTKDGDGFVQFRGNNVLNAAAGTTQTATVSAGVFRLADVTSGVGSIFNNQGDATTFTVNSGATVAGQGTIAAKTITISGNVRPDSDTFTHGNWVASAFSSTNRHTAVDTTLTNPLRVGTLTFEGATTFNGSQIFVDINYDGGGVQTGYDKIMVNGGVTFGTNNNNIDITNADKGRTYDIITITDATSTLSQNSSQFFTVSGTVKGGGNIARYATVKNDNDTAAKIVQVVMSANTSNRELWWIGNVSDVWNVNGARNWSNNPTGVKTLDQFEDGDRIHFDSQYTNPNFTANIAAGSTMYVADMTVSGTGNYIINGNIETVDGIIHTSTFDDPLVPVNEQSHRNLVKSGLGKLTLNGTNYFEKGIEIHDGGRIVAQTAASVNVGSGEVTPGNYVGIKMSGSSTLEFATTGSQTYDKWITGTGDLVKSGSGTLLLSYSATAPAPVTNDYAGATWVNDGKLVGNIAQGTALFISGGATYENGTVAGTNADRELAGLYENSITSSGTVDMQGTSLTVPVGVFGAGVIKGFDTLTKSAGSGTTTLTVGTVTGKNLLHQSGTLGLAAGKKITLTGTAEFDPGTIFTITADTVNPDVAELTAAGAITIGDGNRLNITYDLGHEGRTVLIHSDTSISQNFSEYYINNKIQSDYITREEYNHAVAYLEDNGQNIVIDSVLLWNSTAPGTAHGTFNIDPAIQAEVTIDVDLKDITDSNRFFTDTTTGETWDGHTLTKWGTGTLILTGANTFTGPANVEAGILQIGDGTTGSITSNIDLQSTDANVTFDRNQGYDDTYHGIISGTGTLTKNGTGTITLTGDNAYAGPTYLLNGDLIGNIASGTALYVAVGAGGTRSTYYGGTGERILSSLNGYDGTTGDVDMQGQKLTVPVGDFRDGTISNFSTLVKSDSGIVTDPNNRNDKRNTFIVGTVNGQNLEHQVGTLELVAGKKITLTGTADFADSSIFDIVASHTDENAPVLTAEGIITIGDDTRLNVNYDPILSRTVLIHSEATIGNSGATTYPARFENVYVNGHNMNEGITTARYFDATVAWELDAVHGENIVIDGTYLWVSQEPGTAHGTFQIDGPDPVTVGIDLKDIDDPDLFLKDKDGTPLWDGHTLTKTGDGTLILTGDGNTYSGPTEIKEGTLQIGGCNGTTNGSINGESDVVIAAGAALSLARSGNYPFDNYVSGEGKLIKDCVGTVTITDVNTYTGGTFINNGKIIATNDQSLGDLAGGVTFNDNANKKALELQYEGTFGRTVEGNGTVVAAGTGSLVVNGNLDNFTGTFQQTDGTVYLQSNLGGSVQQDAGTMYYYPITIDGNATYNDIIRPVTDDPNYSGPTGIVQTVEGTLTLTADADYYVNIYSNTTEHWSDHIKANSADITGSTIHIVNRGVVSDYVKANGQVSWVVVDTDQGINGNFGTIDTPTINKLIYKVVYLGLDPNDPTNYIITLALAGDKPFDPVVTDGNTGQVNDVIDDGIKNGDKGMEDLANDLGNLPEDELGPAFDSLRGSEMYADAQTMALWSPWRSVFNRLDNEDDGGRRTECTPCGAVSKPRFSRNAWFEGTYTATDVDRDINAKGYDLTRAGMLVGIDTNVGEKGTLGAVFGYGSPRLGSSFGKIEADDYTFGLYGKYQFSKKWYVNGFVGYGRQNYDATRFDFGGLHFANYDSDAFYASLELVRSFKLNRRFTLLPLFAVDFQQAWTDDFTEFGSGKYHQAIGSSELDRTVLRFGLNTKTRLTNRFSLNTRLQYGRQVGGATNGRTVSHFATSPNTIPMQLCGVDLSRDQLNVGFGGNWYMTKAKRTSLFADYDFDCVEHATAHTGQLGFTTNW